MATGVANWPTCSATIRRRGPITSITCLPTPCCGRSLAEIIDKGWTLRPFAPHRRSLISIDRPLPTAHYPGLFLFGLAVGVSGGNGHSRDRAVDRLLGACIRSCTGRRAIVSAQPGAMPSQRWNLSAGSRAWSTASWKRIQGSGFRVQGLKISKSEISKSEISCCPRRQVRPGLRPDGNHLRHRG